MADAKTIIPGGPTYTPPPRPGTVPRPNPIIPPGAWATRLYVTTDVGIYYTTNFTGPTGTMPTWTTVNTGLPTTSIILLTADPAAPSSTQYALTSEYLYSPPSSNRLYRRQNGGSWSLILAPPTLATLFGLTPYDSMIAGVCTDVNTAGYLAVAYRVNGTTWYYAFSTNYGATWQKHNATAIGSDTNTVLRAFSLGLYKGTSVYATGNVVYLASYTGGGGTKKLWVSTDKGATWTERTGFITAVGTPAEIALQLDPFQDVIYAYCGNGILKSANLGATWTTIAAPGTYPDLDQSGQAVSSGYQLMPLYYTAVTPNFAKTIRAVGYSGDIWKTVNAGGAWTRIVDGGGWGTGAARHEKGILCLGNADAKVYGLALKSPVSDFKHVIQVSTDEGITWVGKSGYNYASSPFASSIPGNANVVGVMPVG